MKNLLLFILLFLFFVDLRSSQSVATYQSPRSLNDGWESNGLNTDYVDTAAISQLLSKLKEGDNQLHSILLIQHNEIIVDAYFNEFKAEQQHDLRSCTKSILSILMGIAVDTGFIKDINEPISTYLKMPIPKKNLEESKERITIKDLLTMSSGLDCNDWDKKSKGQEDKVYRKKDWLQYTLNLPMVNEPGTVSCYCTMGTVLLAEIISQASGMPIDEFAEQYLFTPMNMTNLSWGHTSQKEVIASGKRLNMTTRDMAKIGQLVLNKGKWQGKQIVSKKWIEESTSEKTQITGVAYSYLWWNLSFTVNGSPIQAIMATGNGGQYIMILPEMDVIAVFTGGAYNSQADKLPFAIMQRVLLPALDKTKE